MEASGALGTVPGPNQLLLSSSHQSRLRGGKEARAEPGPPWSPAGVGVGPGLGLAGGWRQMPLREAFGSRSPGAGERGVVSSGAHLAGQKLQNGFHFNTLSCIAQKGPEKSPFLAEMPPALGVCPSSVA